MRSLIKVILVFGCIYCSSGFAQKGGMPTVKKTGGGSCQGVDPELTRAENFLVMQARLSEGYAKTHAEYVSEQEKLYKKSKTVAWTSTSLMAPAYIGGLVLGVYFMVPAAGLAGAGLIVGQAATQTATIVVVSEGVSEAKDYVQGKAPRAKPLKDAKDELDNTKENAKTLLSGRLSFSTGDIARSVMKKIGVYNNAVQEIAAKTKDAMNALPQDKNGEPKFRWWTVGHDDKNYVEILLKEAQSYHELYKRQAEDMKLTLATLRKVCDDIKNGKRQLDLVPVSAAKEDLTPRAEKSASPTKGAK